MFPEFEVEKNYVKQNRLFLIWTVLSEMEFVIFILKSNTITIEIENHCSHVMMMMMNGALQPLLCTW